MNLSTFWGGGGAASYQIEQSLRFIEADNNVLTRNVTTEGNRTTWTFSCWVKRCELGQEHMLFSAATGAHASNPNITYLSISSGERLVAYTRTNTTTNFYLASEKLLRDPSAWYHIVWEHDTTQSTAADRIKLYVNGVQITAFNTNTTPSQNFESFVNNTVDHTIGEEAVRDRYGHEGYLAEIHFVDGTALDATSFGEFDDNGVWRPIRYTGSHGSQGYYLKFDPSATNGIGHDHSGNGNNFTPTGFTTSGTGTDVMSDTPTKNYPTINPIAPLNPGEPYNITNVKNGALEIDNAGSAGYVNNTVIATFQVPKSGKWYWEVTCREYSTAAPSRTGIGVISEAAMYDDGGDFVYADIAGVYSYGANGGANTSPNLGIATYGNTYGVGDVIGVAFDADNGDLYFYKNGTIQNSGTAAFTGLDMTDGFFPAAGYWGKFTFNFGQRAFEYTVPTGYSELNSSTLPAPDIADGSDYFQTVLWTGDNTDDRSIPVADNSGNSWQPDWVWYKRRNVDASHLLFDAVRGATKCIRTDSINEENTESNALQAFESTGFQVGSDGNSNSSSYNYVAWNWLAGNSTTTPTQGTIASTASVNTDSKFSIVSYTGTGNNGSVGHGLGAIPKFIIAKQRQGAANHFAVYHESIGNSNFLKMDTTDGTLSGSTIWNSTTPSSTLFYVGTGNVANYSSQPHIAYCFAEVEGYSKFSSYQNSGSNDGAFVYTGFKPAWVLIKQVDSNNSACHWFIFDTVRNTYNVIGDVALAANKNWLEGLGNNWNPNTSGQVLDIYSNGFKTRTTSTSGFNQNEATYVYAAFAQHPFAGNGVTPATAR